MLETKNIGRVRLLRHLLSELKETDMQITQSTSEIKTLSYDFYNEALHESSEEIKSVIDEYYGNNDRIKAINCEITNKVNQWYEFTKSKTELVKLTYPLSYLLKKRKLKKFICKMNEEISSITIDNRFIKEKLTLLEHQLEIAALSKIKSDETYRNYDMLTEKKEELVTELKYLIPTIPGLCPVCIDISKIDELLARLELIEAA